MADKSDIWKEMAVLYAEREGESYLREAETLPPWPGGEGRLDAKMKRKITGQKYRWRWVGGVSAAAVVAVAIWLSGVPQNATLKQLNDSLTADYSFRIATPMAEPSDDAAAVPEMAAMPETTFMDEAAAPGTMDAGGLPDMALMRRAETLSLPEGFTMVSMAFDDQKTVYAVESNTQNPITVCVEPLADAVFYRESPFREIVLEGGSAYIWVKKEYSVLLWATEGRLFTLTSPYDYRDLIILGESLLL